MTHALLFRNVEVAGRAGLDVRIEGGRIAEIGEGLRGGAEDIDGRGGALIPGLADHHIHLMGLAAQQASIDLARVADAKGFAASLGAGLAGRPQGAWVRAVGYHERMAGELSRRDLDRLAPTHRLRVQDQTGALWVLNSLALDSLGELAGVDCVERDAGGAPTGRIWRGDAWLRARIGTSPPDLAPIGRRLASFGVTMLTDASVTNDASSAERLAEAGRAGDLPQRLMLMSGGALEAPEDAAFSVGPVKVLLDDHTLPDLDDFTARIGRARMWGRKVAVHCVTAGELALTLAAFDVAGAEAGDRIEHGGVIPEAAIGQIRALGLTVVTQSAFVLERGDRYLAEVELGEQPDLYRCASLLNAAIPVAGSSDAPYASADPWRGIAAAVARRTSSGAPIGIEERIAPRRALGLYLDDPAQPGVRPRRVAVGADADLCLLDLPLAEALAAPSAERVAATLVGGRIAHRARSAA